MKFKENPYYNPEKCGLKILKSIDTGAEYEYDIFCVWRKIDDGTLWYDSDSGCSCPSPFDNGDHGHDLKQIIKENWHGFMEALKNHYNITPLLITEVKNKVKSYLK